MAAYGEFRVAAVTHERAPVAELNSDASRLNRPWITTGSGRASGSIDSLARSSIRDTRFTSTASASSALRHASSTREAPHFFTRPRSL